MEKDVYCLCMEEAHGEIIEKKSRFIADIVPVKDEEEALEFIESVRKKFWDARHHCYAYIVGDKDARMTENLQKLPEDLCLMYCFQRT